VRFADIHTAHFSRTSHPKAIRTSLTNHHVIPSTHAFVLVLRGPLEGRAFGISAPSFVFFIDRSAFRASCFGTGFWPLRSLIMPPQQTNGCIVWYSFLFSSLFSFLFSAVSAFNYGLRPVLAPPTNLGEVWATVEATAPTIIHQACILSVATTPRSALP
jgi:hypothetical protein